MLLSFDTNMTITVVANFCLIASLGFMDWLGFTPTSLLRRLVTVYHVGAVMHSVANAWITALVYTNAQSLVLFLCAGTMMTLCSLTSALVVKAFIFHRTSRMKKVDGYIIRKAVIFTIFGSVILYGYPVIAVAYGVGWDWDYYLRNNEWQNRWISSCSCTIQIVASLFIVAQAKRVGAIDRGLVRSVPITVCLLTMTMVTSILGYNLPNWADDVMMWQVVVPIDHCANLVTLVYLNTTKISNYNSSTSKTGSGSRSGGRAMAGTSGNSGTTVAPDGEFC